MNIKTQIKKTYLLFSILFLLILSSCAKEDTMKEINANAKEDGKLFIRNSKTLVELTGEDIFRGIFFYEGYVASNVPYLSESKELFDEQLVLLDTEELVDITNMRNEIVAGVITLNPNYFYNLKQSIIDKDYFVLSQLLKEGAELMQNAALLSPTYSEQFISVNNSLSEINIDDYDLTIEADKIAFANDIDIALTANDNGENTIFASIVVVVGVAVVAAVAVAIGTVAWIYTAAWLPIAPPNGGEGVSLDYYTSSLINSLN